MSQNEFDGSNTCNSEVLNVTTILASPSQPRRVEGKRNGLVGKIPVVIAEANVQVYVESMVKLEEPALEIARSRKNLYLTQYDLMHGDNNSGKLLLSGYVRNNIEYSTAKVLGNSSVSGYLSHTTVNIPFKCFAKIDFTIPPESNTNDAMVETMEANDGVLGANRQVQGFVNSERFNEKIYCELTESRIHDTSVKQDARPLAESDSDESTFQSFRETMVIELRLRLLQNQHVEIPAAAGSGDEGGSKGGSGSGKGSSEGSGKGGDSGKSGGSSGGGKDGKDGKDGKGGKDNKGDKDDKGDKEDKGDKGDKEDKEDKEGKHGEEEGHGREGRGGRKGGEGREEKAREENEENETDNKESSAKNRMNIYDNSRGTYLRDMKSNSFVYVTKDNIVFRYPPSNYIF